MSDEFIKLATQEINEGLDEILDILQKCSNENDFKKNSNRIEQHMHKIKGLAPMMGKENVGNLAKILDSNLKKVISGKRIDGFFELLPISVEQMRSAMGEPYDLSQIQKQVSDISLKIVD